MNHRHTAIRPTGGTQDAVTILATSTGHSASKRFVKTDAGIAKIDFNAGRYFDVMQPQIVCDIYALSDVLMAVETFPNMLVIRGRPVNDELIGNRVRRKGSGNIGNFFTPPQGRRWILIDFDKIPIPKRLSLKGNPVSVCEYLVKKLPAEFHGASYHWQMSSSAGIGDPSKVSMHIWFWLDRPIPDSDLKVWGKSVNDKAGFKVVDTALFQHVQPHYTAAPIFEGMADPFPTRSGVQVKACDSVSLVLPAAPTARATVRLKRPPIGAPAGSGFEYHLSRIGDHAGGDGFHAPITAAAASYVRTNGEDGTDTEVLYNLISQRVLAADATHHDAAYVQRMASRDHIIPAIESALKKFGAQPASRRKARIVSGIKPHFESTTMSLDTALHRLAEFASR